MTLQRQQRRQEFWSRGHSPASLSPVNFGEQILCDKPKSKLYTDLLPLIDSGAIDILENDKLLMQIVGLE